MKKKLMKLLALPIMILCLNAAFITEVLAVSISESRTVEYDKEELLSALYEADIASIREAIDLRLITCRELTEYYLERIEKYNKTFNCFITICDNALEEADKRDAELLENPDAAKGRLFGVPVVVKDNIEYEGYYTTNGYKFSQSKVSVKNAAIVQRLLDEGAIIIGKGNMSTEAQEARRTSSRAAGETYNAYNTKLASGGSSGGSAVATSLNFATASLGTDTNSSLRYPAALNGCVSLRPTFGLIDKDGCIILNKRRDTAGAITRTVSDQAVMLDVITGGVNNYEENMKNNSDALNGMRIGILKELAYPVKGVANRTASVIDDEIEKAFADAVEEFRACGAEVIEVSMPNIFNMSSACTESKTGWEKAKEKFYAAFESVLSDNDIAAVIFPTYLSAPLYTGINANGGLVIYDQIWVSNCSVLSSPIGLPEISVPIGIHSRGAGIGLEIASLKNSEQLLLNIAYSYTEKYNHRTVPKESAPDIYEGFNAGTLNEFIAAYKETLNKIKRMNENDRLRDFIAADSLWAKKLKTKKFIQKIFPCG